ncbi:MAG: hypothetical protein VB131_00040 [Burkholderia gladioli]
MNNIEKSASITRDEILIALAELNEDPTASRVDAFAEELREVEVPNQDRVEVVRQAVCAARQRIDASAAHLVDPNDLPFMTVVGGHVLIHDAHSGEPLNAGWTGICVDARDTKCYWYIGHDASERSFTKLVATSYETALLEAAERGVLANGTAAYSKPIGYTRDGFVVGHAAKLNRGIGTATIVDLRYERDELLVTVEFEEPQKIDWPLGEVTRRMEVGFGAVASTWPPNDGNMPLTEQIAALGHASAREAANAVAVVGLRQIDFESAKAYQGTPDAAARKREISDRQGVSPEQIAWVEPREHSNEMEL